jgi:hypothetical protein
MLSMAPSALRILLVRFYGLLGTTSRVTPPQRTRPLSGSHASLSQLRTLSEPIAVLVVCFVLLNISGCSGGFQGYRPVAPTVSQPASVTVPLGQTAAFTVSATGTGALIYQWFKNGVAIPGATSSSYTTPPTVAGDTGSVFTVSVSNSAGSATSGPATLTVQLPLPVAKSIVPSSATPPYNTSVMLVPTFSGGTAVIGSAGVGSSDISTSAVSGSSYPTPLLTSPTIYLAVAAGNLKRANSMSATAVNLLVCGSKISALRIGCH